MTANLSNPGAQVVKPIRLAHIVLKTQPSNFKKMVDFYATFLSATVSYENEYIAFLSYDSEHHRVAILAMPDITPRDPKSAGLLHFAFTFANLNDLALGYLQRKANGITPYWCVNHGPTMSMYYHDPDGNDIETQVDSFETAEKATAFMVSKEFAENPIGVDFVPEDLIKRLEAGESEEKILVRENIGPRGVPTFDE
ncbi:Glyoxalase/Bleomycin resistance protein/Dihydroxybiphenyl dioxygenase [Mollisia scopiformis]|uniref:Glyoxalase/Bleomycin resistance protein/Dihydroxybiphenyl dioxygenase n=1 Tax=Mollisia scopiformis TaxID=149040 RepID=A0A194WYT0_MOLSC|nr:Glyoxalase/Bleomycin resistance protein/Dihydroxybiphenyl dioxygenase [Mollisia scopiformis]KUJ12757.1 Glyoxalase/Bleomycin resistance protein/Dihydroxybiphenyl dioxygenase [Mollisia scopiformis]